MVAAIIVFIFLKQLGQADIINEPYVASAPTART